MFNPVFNKDGSVSYFRVCCLITAVSCLICGCVMKSSKPDDLSDLQAQTALLAEEDTPSVDNSLEIREKAVAELAQNTEFMQTCGTLDRSYDNCVVELSEDLKPYYSMDLESSDDGYSLILKATDNNTDTCRLFESNSNGELIGLNEQGESDKNCLLDLANGENNFKVSRDTDNKSGQSAPSGLAPIVKHLTNR